MKIIMYHYIRESLKQLPNFRYLHIENFKKQLDFFEKEFGFVTYNVLLIRSSKMELLGLGYLAINHLLVM